MKRLFFIALLAACGPQDLASLKEPMNQLNDPKLIPGAVTALEYAFSKLPSKGEVSRLWSGWWWPLSEGGTASTRYGRPSPLGKHDLITGKKANDWEIESAKRYSNVGWAGHCNGVSAASIMLEEPTHAVTYKDVPFSVEDIKALLAESWQGSGRIIGDRCDKKAITFDQYGRIKETECRDVNAGTFHLALTNYLGLFGKAIIADMDSTEAVWNYPIQSYTVLAQESLTKDEAIWRVRKEANTFYAYNAEAVDFVYVKTSITFLNFDPRHYEYILELDVKGKVLGGEWLEKNKKDHPDFIWRPSDPIAENPHLDSQVINAIYKQSL